MLPLARKEGLHVEKLPDEVMVYDTARHKAHCLSPFAAAVWRHCDGKTSATEIAKAEGVKGDVELVWMALHRLSKLGLLEEKVALPQNAVVSSRRELMKKAAIAGGMLFFLTATISAPTPAQACSGDAPTKPPSRPGGGGPGGRPVRPGAPTGHGR